MTASSASAIKTAEPWETGKKSRTNFQLAKARFLRQKLAVFGLVIVLIFVFLAVVAPLVAPTSYDQASLLNANQFPSREFPFGTDTIGHNMVSRVIYGIRTSLIVAGAAVSMACLIGIPLGVAAGLRGGWTDFIILRIVEIMTALPGILFAIFLMSVINSGAFTFLPNNQVLNVAFVIAITSWVPLCRLMRAQILTLREQEYVTSARAIGATELRVAMTHLFPNAIPPMIIALTLGIPAAIFAEAGLSFIGVGVNEPVPSLGKMVSDSRQYIQLYWHLALFPSLAIALAVLGFAFLGDGLRDALDPRQI
jgi:ABC-type dipeptide/oligopeptide/nickel transport system permease subunit